MSLEDQIKALELKLAIKNAYLNAQVVFPKNFKVSDEVKDIVVSKLREYCVGMADESEAVPAPSQVSNRDTLSAEEITVLKTLAAKVLQKTTTANNVVQMPEQPVQETHKAALVLTTENVERSLRSKISSNDKVEVLKNDEKYALVMTKLGNRVRIPLEDLDFNLAEGG